MFVNVYGGEMGWWKMINNFKVNYNWMIMESERVLFIEDLWGIVKIFFIEFMLLERVFLLILWYLNGFGSCFKIFIKFVVLFLSKEFDLIYLFSFRVLCRM